MGFINELKKAFFGAKSVAKSVGREIEEKAKDVKEDLEDWVNKDSEEVEADLQQEASKIVDDPKGGALDDDLFNLAEEKLKETSETVSGTFDQLTDKAQVLAENIGDKLQEAAEEVEERIMDTNREEDPEWLKSAKEKTEELGEKVMETGDKLWDKAKELGGDLKGKFDDLVEKANEEVAKEKLEDQIEKAEKTAEEIAEQVKKDTRGGGMLGGHESFFDKAARFAEGDYRNEGDMRIEKSDAPEEPPVEDDRKVKGFEDLDGDGDEIIDDAILDKD